jgi:hypothetical protein
LLISKADALWAELLTQSAVFRLEISDRQGAATTASHLLTEALRPAVADVRIAFPPGVERIYPRDPRALLAGSTFTAVGRVKGEMPRQVELSYRTAEGVKTESLAIKPRSAMDAKEVRRRWASARVEELAFKAAGREAATDVAYQEKLLTPWTARVLTGDKTYEPTPLSTRLLDLEGVNNDAYSALLSTEEASFGALTDPIDEPEDDLKPDNDLYQSAVRRAGERMILAAGKHFRACRNARAALRPDLTGSLIIQVAPMERRPRCGSPRPSPTPPCSPTAPRPCVAPASKPRLAALMVSWWNATRTTPRSERSWATGSARRAGPTTPTPPTPHSKSSPRTSPRPPTEHPGRTKTRRPDPRTVLFRASDARLPPSGDIRGPIGRRRRHRRASRCNDF